MKKMVFAFKTLGCRLNQAEEESLRRQVMEQGHFVSEPARADICIVNTCSVTAVADKKSHMAIKRLKKENPNLKIVVIGCGAKMAKDYPEIDLWVENSEKKGTLKKVLDKFSNMLANKEPKQSSKKALKRTRALLKIQDGCNNFCAYCIVPHLRGREVSYSMGEVIDEAKKLEEMGCQELVLSGVNVGKYQVKNQRPITINQKEVNLSEKDRMLDLTGLIKELLEKTAFPRIRLSSINPQDVTDGMIELWAKEDRLCPHFHLSLQSGSNKILKKMGRPYSREDYLKLSKKIAQKVPNAAITTDVIVGFPGETDDDFKDSFELAKEVGLAKLHVFRYSKRAGTRASLDSEQISDSIKKERSQKLLKLSKELEDNYRERYLGKVVEVLFEEQKDGFFYGLTPNYIRVKLTSKDDLTNKLKKIKLQEENLA